MIGAQRHCMSDKANGILVADEAETVAESQRAKGNDRNIQSGASEAAARQRKGRVGHRSSLWLVTGLHHARQLRNRAWKEG